LLLGNFLSPNWVIESFQLLTKKNKNQSSLGNFFVIIWKYLVILLTMARSPPIDQTIKFFDHCPMFFSNFP